MKKKKIVSRKPRLRLKNKVRFKKFDVCLLLERFACTIGAQRSGKTSFNRAIMNTFYKKHGKDFLCETNEHIKVLNSNGFNLSNVTTHCFYSNHKCSLDNKKKCHDVFFEDLVIPGSNFKGQHFPFRSFIEYQELDKDADNRDWRNFDLSHKDFFKFFGHNGLTILTDTQDYDNCDKKLRGLFTDLIFIYERVRIKHWWQLKPRYTWYFFLKDNQLAEALKELNQFTKIDVPVVQAYKFTYKGEIHNTYESKSGEPLYLNGLKKYRFRKHLDLTLSPEDVSKFCSKYISQYSKKKKVEEELD